MINSRPTLAGAVESGPAAPRLARRAAEGGVEKEGVERGEVEGGETQPRVADVADGGEGEGEETGGGRALHARYGTASTICTTDGHYRINLKTRGVTNRT